MKHVYFFFFFHFFFSATRQCELFNYIYYNNETENSMVLLTFVWVVVIIFSATGEPLANGV